MDFGSAVAYIRSYLSYEDEKRIHYNEKNFDLNRFKDFLKAYGVDFSKLKYVHVGGSKGKGSTSTMIALYLKEAGYKTALFTSPYILDIRETFWINGRYISEKKFISLVEDLKNFLEQNAVHKKVTYFEFLTAIALKYFIEQKVDYAVLEVGLGGRLDSTNVIDSELAVITPVEKEHAGILGDTLEEILNEKLGIIKKRTKVVISYQGEEARKIIAKKLKDNKKVVFVEDEVICKNGYVKGKYLYGDFLIAGKKISGVKINTVNQIQLKNAACMMIVVKNLLGSIDQRILRKSLEKFKIIGRMDLRKAGGKTVVFDMAHTHNSIANLIDSLKKVFPKKEFVFLLSIMKDKEVGDILKGVFPQAQAVYFTFSHPIRSWEVDDLEKMAKELFPKFRNLYGEHDCGKAYRMALKSIKKNQLLVVTGSHFLIREIIKAYF